jgi:hypothetical protein
MTTQYHFLSTFSLSTEPERVWSTLAAIEAWPTWWRWLKRVDVLRPAAGPDNLGLLCRNHVRARTGYGFVYTTEITEVDHGRRIDVVSGGDLVGRGRFLLRPRAGGGTELLFAWLVGTPQRWMNLLAPIARPAFNWNHDILMTDFGNGLAAASGGRVLSASNRAISPKDSMFQVIPTGI